MCGFAVLDDFFFGFPVSNIPQCPPLHSLPINGNSKQRTRNPSKSLKIPHLRQKEDNLPKVRYIFSDIPLQMKQTVNTIQLP